MQIYANIVESLKRYVEVGLLGGVEITGSMSQ